MIKSEMQNNKEYFFKAAAIRAFENLKMKFRETFFHKQQKIKLRDHSLWKNRTRVSIKEINNDPQLFILLVIKTPLGGQKNQPQQMTYITYEKSLNVPLPHPYYKDNKKTYKQPHLF